MNLLQSTTSDLRQECRAEQTRDPFIKQQLIEIAEKWRHMAAHLEKYSR
jgi:hypothetical protein